jgi:hypothetical protein
MRISGMTRKKNGRHETPVLRDKRSNQKRYSTFTV